jgi:hypothetical protein
MNWKTSYLDDEKVVNVTYSGTISRTELSAAAQSALELSLKHGTNRVLTDCSDMHGGHSVADLYFLSDWLASVNAHRMREAVLLPTEAAFNELVQFWQTTCTNRGLNVRVFDSAEVARQWLLERPHTTIKPIKTNS